MRIRTWGGCALVALAVTSTAQANFLQNGGLELNPLVQATNGVPFVTAGPATNNTALPDWTITTGTVDVVPNTYWQSTQGTYSVDLVGTPGIGSIRQMVPLVNSSNDYTLSFDWAPNPETWSTDESGTTKILLMQAWNSTGSSMIAQNAYFLTDGTRTDQNMQFVSDTFDFTATGPILLVISAVTPANLPTGESSSFVFMGPVIDNLDLELAGSTGGSSGGEPVPEPASLSVLGIGGLMLLRRRRRGA